MKSRHLAAAIAGLALLAPTTAIAADGLGDGAPDSTFGDAGYAFAGAPGFEMGRGVYRDLVQQADGKLLGVLGGGFPGDLAVAVRRVAADGTPDTDFGDEGTAEFSLDGGGVVTPTSVRELADGSIVAAGWWSDWGDSGTTRVFLLHLDATGAPVDAAAPFRISTVETACPEPLKVFVRADGGAVAVTRCDKTGFGTDAYTSDAAPDGEYAAGVHLGAPAQDAVLGADRLYVAGEGYDDATQRYSTEVTALDGAGHEVAAFDGDGHATFPGQPGSIALAPGGKLLLGGTGEQPSDEPLQWRIQRVGSDGTLDPEFGTGGGTTVDGADFGDDSVPSTPQMLAAAPDGKVYAGADASGRVYVVRLTADGRLDPAFATAGKPGHAVYELESFLYLDDLLVQGDGKPVLALESYRGYEEGPSLTGPRIAAQPRGMSVALLRLTGTLDAPPAQPEKPADKPADRPAATTTETPAAAVAAQGPARNPKLTRSCVSRRQFTIRLRPRNARLVSAKVRVNGKVVAVRRGSRLRSTVDLRHLPLGAFKVVIDTRTADGRTLRDVRSYRTCRVGPAGRPVKGGSKVVVVD